jgi:hypothetical protein
MGLLKAFAREVQSVKIGKPPRRQDRQDFFFQLVKYFLGVLGVLAVKLTHGKS